MITRAKKEEIVRRVKALAEDRQQGEKAADLKRYIEGFYVPSSPADLADETPDELYHYARSMWELARTRTPGRPTVRVFNPDRDKDGWTTSHTAIQIINDDMPFLVDSITGGLTITRKIGIHVLHHPIFVVRRDDGGGRRKTEGPVDFERGGKAGEGRESHIYIEIDFQSSPKRLKEIEKGILEILADVRVSVEGWPPMLGKVDETIAELGDNPPPLDMDTMRETQEFLRWLAADHFTFLGYREYRFEGDPETADFRAVRGSGLGLLRDPKFLILRGPKGFTAISPEIREFLSEPDPVIITKANVKTRVHRPVHLDYIGIKKFDENGQVIGERRFVGLFTSQSYARRAQDVPILRRKVRNVQRRSHFMENSHAGKTLLHILESFPRDELFQITEDQLLDVSLGVISLLERPRARAFIRRDKFERFVSALVYVPRDKYNSTLRRMIENILCEAFNGEISVYYAQLSEDVLARWHFIIRTKPGQVPDADEDDINRRIHAASKDWNERLHEVMVERLGKAQADDLFERYTNTFSEAYKEAFRPYQAVLDVEELEKITSADDLRFALYQLEGENGDHVRLKIYGGKSLVPLSECMPMLENLGLMVVNEFAYRLEGASGCIHDFSLRSRDGNPVRAGDMEDVVESLLELIWKGRMENDGFNKLAIHARLDAWQILILRAYAKYLRQLGMTLSQDYIEDTLLENTGIARKLVALFEIGFRPKSGKKAEREAKRDELVQQIRTALNKVASLDQDRIIRGYLTAILSTVRTNFYQRAFRRDGTRDALHPGLAFKIQSGLIDWAPRPRPFAEIFVYSPRYEGVHLRSGPVARGGLRWSDRREDFRTEILGLVKAQQVKNAVIVPVGAKGGFVPKRLPADGSREDVLAEGLACYKSFIASLLSVTDNLQDGRVHPPKAVVRWDRADPYLVVAADKGTATFSDIANDIALAHDFWLGDAFASGGSNGYDHKKMGITARGAWVSVERHFREMGRNIAKDPFDVIGIGDMSGDVFGNGMLLSKAIRLRFAFDHRHIFFDPDPDPAKSWKERARLFKKPRSTWDDYDKAKMSRGGKIIDRSAKSVKLNRELKDFLEVDADELTPTEILHHGLKARADLLWVGGIGTYVKSAAERNTDVGDRANDGLRINGADLRVKVVGEGGNLGLTQKGRIEFARAGGRVNTDFIDNSAGVDCSDKEVNIKILLNDALNAGDLDGKARSELLARMTDDVAGIVLADNYLQTQAISLAEEEAVRNRENHAGLVRMLERDANLDRQIEDLPSEDGFHEMAAQGEGLTRPELAIVLAYTKMSLNDVLVRSKLMDDPLLRPELEWGFPDILRKTYAARLDNHQLRREIVATTMANQVINRAGLTFVYEVKEETGLSVEQIISAFILVRDAFGLHDIWSGIDALDYKVDSATQMEMHTDVSQFLRQQVIWFLHNAPRPLKIDAQLEKFQKGLTTLLNKPERVFSPLSLEAYRRKLGMLEERNVPKALARKIAVLTSMNAACDIVAVASRLKRNVEDVGKAYFELGHQIGFEWLLQTLETVHAEDHWDQLALHAIEDDLADQQRELTRTVLNQAKKLDGCAAAEKWIRDNQVTVFRAARLLGDLKSAGQLNVSKLSFATRHMRSILQ